MGRRRNTQVRVYVVEYGRDNLMLRIRWPDGTIEHETAGTVEMIAAKEKALERQKQLREKQPQANGQTPWSTFRDLLTKQLLSGLAPKTRDKYRTVLDRFERLIKPAVIGDATTQNVSKFVGEWRAEGGIDSTMYGELGHLGAAFRWAVDQEYLDKLPKIRRPQIVDREPTKGRAVTDAEFKRLLKATPKIMGEKAPHWTHLLEGLYLSGLRLGEALSLSWDIPGTIQVDFSGKYPMLDIPGKRQKNREAQLYPVVREFAEFLKRTPRGKRTGHVFQVPTPIRFGTEHRRLDTVSKIITDIGEAAGIVVDKERGKFASAHDLRRSFGVRWSNQVQPAELQALMRHKNLETTMRFYARQKSDALAAKIWISGNIVGNKPKPTTKPKKRSAPKKSKPK